MRNIDIKFIIDNNYNISLNHNVIFNNQIKDDMFEDILRQYVKEIFDLVLYEIVSEKTLTILNYNLVSKDAKNIEDRKGLRDIVNALESGINVKILEEYGY